MGTDILEILVELWPQRQAFTRCATSVTPIRYNILGKNFEFESRMHMFETGLIAMCVCVEKMIPEG